MSGRMNSQQVVRNLFGLSEEEDVLDDFSCALRKAVFIHGRLFCTDNFLCFYANILGFKTKQVIPFKEVKAIRKQKNSISNCIEVKCANGKSYFFGSFLRHNEAFHFIFSLWRNSGYCDEDQDTGNWSDNEDPPTAPSVEEEKEEVNILPAEEVTDAFETLRTVVPVSPKKFFELFFSESAEYSIMDYAKDRGDTEIESTPWAQNEELNAYSRELKYRTKINGPSIGPKTTRCHRVQIYSMTDNKLTVKTSTKALDVPYSSYFVVEDEWNITEMSPDKSLLRCTVVVNMLKSTMFRSKIESRTKSDVTKDMEQWFKEAKKHCLGDQPTPPPVEKPAEKQIHQIAKYEEVDLRTFQKKTSIKSGIQATTKNILIVNSLLVLLLFFYLRYLHTRLNELSFPVTSEV